MSETTIRYLVEAIRELLLASSKVRVRIKERAPALTKFSEWEDLTFAMTNAERVIESSNEKLTA